LSRIGQEKFPWVQDEIEQVIVAAIIALISSREIDFNFLFNRVAS